VAGVVWFLAPFAASPQALLALQSDDRVTVTSSTNRIEMSPLGHRSGYGLIFQPGARVDARAYAAMLRPIAEAGHQVVIVKQPLGIAFLAHGFAPSWAEKHPETERWVVGGHSLGGVVASENAADPNELDHLVLWASFPASDLSDRSNLRTVSIFGTNDELTTLSEIEASRADLPDGTSFVPVAGAVHSHFGDYGLQPGDGEPGLPRAEAQELIIGATLAFLAVR
jgi:hypothetical protein